MADRKIKITTEFLAQLKGMDEVVSKMKTGLQDANKEAIKSTNFTKLFSDYTDEYKKFKSFIGSDGIDILDSKEALRSGEKIIKLFKQIQSNYGDLSNMDVNLAKKLFPSEFTGQAKKAQEAIDKYENSVKRIDELEVDLSAERTELERLRIAAESAQNALNALGYKPGDLEKLQEEARVTTLEVEKLQQQLREKLGLSDDTDLEKELVKIKENQKTYQEAQQAKKNYNKTYGEGKQVKEIQKEIDEVKELIRLLKEKNNLQKGQKLPEEKEARRKELVSKIGISNQGEATKKNKELEAHKEARIAVDTNIEVPDEEISQLANKFEQATQKSENLKKQLEQTSKTARQYALDQKKLGDANAKLDQQNTKVQQLENSLSDLKNSQGNITNLFNTLNQIGANPEKLAATSENLEKIKKNLSNMDETTKNRIVEKLQEMGLSAEQAEQQVDELRNSFRGIGDEAKEISKAEQEMENLKNQVLQFFSITNSIQLFKRAVTSALNTVKELDATMTEAAVVTEFDVGDMWNRLPEYSANAQKLGVSINGMYQATTLYYQQGLKTNEAMQVGIETMKMAKIAGMDSAQATEAMTAALRGFNMELNETSATRVNDVYSQLAAVTAADTEQIATAMEKTASIAASANMEFETTAALLAQIIETTQEAPETAGTAMKTIIARFAEVKKLRDQGQATGTDSEGEAIDVNKIQTALRTVGISMDGFFAGTEGLDSVLLKLADKWATLDFETQRYIATMAAGSRQQSRFIAMMSDYGRTTELVSEAQNSAGASQRQFEKTQDSLEVKLQKLKNAWDQFLMGLSNNEAIKFAVDALTKILEGINGIIDGISGGNGLMKTITSLVGVIGALKLGQGIFGGKALGGIGGFLGKMTGQFGAVKETITETKGPGDSIVRTIVKEPVKEGEQAGQQAGQGFVTGFKRAISAGKEGVGLKGQLGAMFTTGQGKEVTGKDIGGGVKRAKEKQVKNQKKIQDAKTTILASAYDANQENLDFDPSSIQKLEQVYDDMIAKGGSAKDATNAVNAELENMGLTTAEIGPEIGNVSVGLENATLDMNAMGQATMGVGATLGGLSAIFSALGMDEAAEATSTLAGVFMGLGTVMSTLSTIAPMLGMSFTTAGVQITTAGVTSQLAWWWVFIIIGAVAALTVGVVALAKAAKEQSLAGQMEKAQQATEAATQAAESAKTAYDDLLNAQSEYSSLQETLENLTKGTDKWKQALIEANAQVLQLLSTYPQLAEFISRGENGQLVISEAGFEKLINDQQNALQRAQAAMVSSQMGETRVQAKMDEREFKQNFQVNLTYDEDKGYVDSYGKNHSSIPENYQMQQAQGSDSGFYYDQNLIDDLQFVLKSGDLSNEALAPLVDEYKLVGESTKDTIARLHELCLALNEYDAALLANQTQMQAQAEALLVAGADQAILDSEYNNSVVSGFAKRMTEDDYANIEQNFSKQMYTNKTNEDAGRKKYMEEELGLTSTGDELKDLQLIYKKLAGLKSIEDIPEDIAQNSQALADQIGKMQAAEQQIDKMEGFQQKLNKVNKEDSIAAKSIASLMSGDASNLTLKELEQVGKLSDYAGVLGYADTETMAKDLGYTQKQLSELELEDQRAYAATQIVREEGQTDEEYQDKLDEWINNQGSFIINASVQMDIDSEQYKQQMQEAHEKASAILASKKINQGAHENLAIETVQNLSEQVLLMSDTDAQAYVENFNSILEKSKLGENEKKQLESYLSNVDWSSMTEAVNAIDYMQSMGIDSSAIEKYWNVATDGAKTYISSLQEALNLSERMQKKVQDVVDIEKRLNEGKGTYEDMMELSKAGVDISKFELTHEGWKATADEIEGATDKLRQYNAEQARAVANQQKEKWEAAKKDTGDGLAYDEKTGQFTIANGYAGIGKVTSIDANGKLVAGEVTADEAATIANQLGESGYDASKETYDQFVARIQAAYNEYINLLNNGEDIQIVAEKTAQMIEIGQYQSQIEQRETANLIDVNPDQQETLKKAIEETTKATSGAEAAMAIFIKDMSNEEKQAAKNNTTLQLLAIRHAKAAAAVQNLKDKLNNNIEILKKGSKGEDKYLKAIDEISIAAKDVFGDKATTDFVENNKKLFIQMQKGGVKGQEAFRKIRDKILEAKAEAGELSKDDLGDIKAIFNDLDGQNIKIGVDFDATQAVNSLLALGYKAEEVQKMMQDAGYAVEFETVTHYIGQLSGIDYGTKVSQTIGENVVAQQVVVATGTKIDDGSDNGNNNTGSGGSNSKWENPYDKFYNTLREINEELRVREQLERRYQKLIKTRAGSANELFQLSQKELEQLKKEADLQEELKKGRQEQIDELVAKKQKKYGKYVQVSEGENGEREIRINWDEINKIKGTKKGEALEEYISQLEEWAGDIEDANDTLDNIEDTVYEIEQRGREEYLDLEERIKDALVQSYQTQIDKLTDINDSINDTNSRLLDAMQESIAEQRQARENEKTEEDLADKQRRLAYLRQDTSGANALEIMQLEKELDEGMESYTDQLIDQKISELQKQNDEAAEQREKQIQIAQAQLEQYEKSGAIWSEVDELMAAYLDPNEGPTGKLLELLQSEEGFKGLSRLGKEEWMKDLKNAVAQAMQYVMGEGQLENIEGMAGQQITVTDKNGNTYTGTVDEKGNFTSNDGTVRFKNVYKGLDGNFYTSESEEEGKKNLEKHLEEQAWAKEAEHKYSRDGKEYIVSEIDKDLKKGDTGNEVRALQWALKNLGYRQSNPARNFGKATEDELKAFQTAENIEATGILDDKTRTKFRLKGYKTGGLADFTGPAWLDGTKAHPEYILNAEQTKSFFELVDVLGSLKSGTSQSSQITGDSIYDVDINVESIGSDYDVEQLAQTVKRMINDDARYRNNNAINLSR